MVRLEDIKKEAARILGDRRVDYLVGYRRASNSWKSRPFFMARPEDAEELIWDPSCVDNLVRYLVDEKKKRKRQKNPDSGAIGLIVKGCDSRAVNVLLQEKYISRDEVYLIGVSCEGAGVIDEKKVNRLGDAPITAMEFSGDDTLRIHYGEKIESVAAAEILADRCLRCREASPVLQDVLFGEKQPRKPDNPYQSIEPLERADTDERWAFWSEHFDRCLRCYACRSVCPMCYCDECVVDSISLGVVAETSAEEKARRIKWLERSPGLSENIVFHLTRALHLAGRCIDCGECERVCPVHIPIRSLNMKMEREAEERYDYRAGLDPESSSLVSSFRDEDPEDFIR